MARSPGARQPRAGQRRYSNSRLDFQLWLIAFAGEAGTGKSTLSRALGRRLRWPVIDKDDIKDVLHGNTEDQIAGPLAYEAMFRVARRQLLLGLSVICDSPLTGQIGYDHAVHLAHEMGATLAVVECQCPDEAIWRERINARKALRLPAHHQTDWDAMQERRKVAAAELIQRDAHRRLVVDTVQPVDLLCDWVVAWLKASALGAIEEAQQASYRRHTGA